MYRDSHDGRFLEDTVMRTRFYKKKNYNSTGRLNIIFIVYIISRHRRVERRARSKITSVTSPSTGSRVEAKVI